MINFTYPRFHIYFELWTTSTARRKSKVTHNCIPSSCAIEMVCLFTPSCTSLIVNTKAKASYKVRNWKKYDAALKLRGSITFWVSEEVVEQWRNEKKTFP